jgi:ABC-2 type transport system ATP-binding protein
MLDVQNLSKSFSGIPAVREVTFQARPGEVTGYLGPNGAGKSTTVRMLAGLMEPDRGSILLDGEEVRLDPVAYKRQLGYVPEHAEIYLHLTPEEYLEFVGRLRGLPERLIREKVDGFLDLFGIASSRYRLLAAYSKGMRQKVLLAGALLHDPRVLLLGEPLSGLDVRSVLLVRELVPRLAGRGRIILFSTHILEIAEKVCSHVLIIHKGRIVASGPMAELRDTHPEDSLEHIFSEAVELEDPARAAGQMAEIVRLGS